jgi:hypothetical protein
MDSYLKKLEEENAALQKRNTELEDRCVDLLQKERKLDEEIAYFNSIRTGCAGQGELMARLVVQFESERNLDIKENNDISPAMEEWNKFNEKMKGFKKFRKRRYPKYDKLMEGGYNTPEEIEAYKSCSPLGEFVEEDFAWDDPMPKWQYNKMSEEERKEYDNCKKYMNDLLKKFYYNEES